MEKIRQYILDSYVEPGLKAFRKKQLIPVLKLILGRYKATKEDKVEISFYDYLDLLFKKERREKLSVKERKLITAHKLIFGKINLRDYDEKDEIGVDDKNWNIYKRKYPEKVKHIRRMYKQMKRNKIVEAKKIHTFSLSGQIKQGQVALASMKDKKKAKKKTSLGDYLKQKKMGTAADLKKEMKKKQQKMMDTRSQSLRQQRMGQ